MKRHIDFFQRKWSKRVIECKTKKTNISDWLLKGDIEILKPIQLPIGSFEIGNYSNSYAEYLVFESLSFACAAIESYYHAIQKPEFTEKSLCWNVVELYYCAYYAAHSIIRLCGRSCNQIYDFSKIEQIHRSIYSKAITIDTGYYHTVYDDSLQKIKFSRLEMSKNDGVHQKLWQSFSQLLIEVYNPVDLNSTQHQQAQSEIFSLTNTFSHRKVNTSGWLSTVRNNTNYKLDYGIWFPYNFKIHSLLTNIIQSNSFDESMLNISSNEDIIKFASACMSIYYLLLANLNAIILYTNTNSSIKKTILTVSNLFPLKK